jgi:hypothetical protein
MPSKKSVSKYQVKTLIGKYGVKLIYGDQESADRANAGGATQIVLRRRKRKFRPPATREKERDAGK